MSTTIIDYHQSLNIITSTGGIIKKVILFLSIIVLLVACAFMIIKVVGSSSTTRSQEESNSSIKNSEEWLGIFLQEQRVGYSFTRISPTEAGFDIENRTKYTLNMMGEVRTLISHLSARTDKACLLTDFITKLETTGHSTEVEGEINGLQLTLTSYSQGVAQTKTIKLTEKPYLPVMIENIIEDRNLKPGDEISIPCFDPTTQFSATTTIEVIGKELIEVFNKRINGLRIETTFMGIKTITWLDDEYRLIKKSAPGMMNLEMIPLTSEQALAEIEANEAFDLLSFVAVKVNGLMPHPQRLSYLKLELQEITPENLDLKDDYQSVMLESPLTLEFRLPVMDDLPDLTLPIDEHKEFLEPSLYIQCDNAEIIEAVDSIIGEKKNAKKVVRKLVEGVYEMLRKNPIASLPSAIDVLKTREGDCNEHSVLFAAFARAKGIPTKIYAGLVSFQGHAYYYHAWCAVWLGKWVPVDPTFNQFPADVGHLKLIEGEISEWPRVYKVVSKLKVKVMDYQEK